MFYRRAQEYIIAYKMMIHKQTLAVFDIYLFTNISVDRIEKMVIYFKLNRCALDFDVLFLFLIVR